MQPVLLFFTFLKISLFAIGGAYTFLPLMERDLVDKYQWLTKEEFIDILGITRMFPGAISIKFASYTGYKIAGIPGLLAANAGNLIATVALVVFASTLYMKFKDSPHVKEAFTMIQLAVCAMLISLVVDLAKSNTILTVETLLSVKAGIVVCASLVLFLFTRTHPAFIILGAGMLGVIFSFLNK